ncbi:hypothetical protein M011DRAFT_479969 [Sporormia fimetaria CBS 119925]|uniref:Myb-like domain-containing protein n=1 Tax=Sporormia fimetaria CBS 119925 TaxID=1340428 RepID=A0A6A6V3I8_9PLEO|nr:hypothetical protein M011DRAFT_479969 [Sporormia fimetaria CBS 119925]
MATQMPKSESRCTQLLPGELLAPNFTLEDDELIVILREEKELTWKDIAEFLPDQTPLSVEDRYEKSLKDRPQDGTNVRSEVTSTHADENGRLPSIHELALPKPRSSSVKKSEQQEKHTSSPVDCLVDQGRGGVRACK